MTERHDGEGDGRADPAADASELLRAARSEIERLREAVKARDDFLSIAAHELRNPMNALGLEVEVMLRAARRGGDEVLLGRLEQMARTLRRFSQRAVQLLDVSRAGDGMPVLSPGPLDLVALVREVAEEYAPEARFHQVALSVHAPEQLQGQWDRLAVSRVLANLVSNAIRYGAGAPVEISVEERPDLACIIVRDHGVGISAEDRNRITGRFEQVIGAGGPRSGFGVGLWVVGRLLRALGGSLEIESVPGKGSVMTVLLPLGR